jgi:hypothetical protein
MSNHTAHDTAHDTDAMATNAGATFPPIFKPGFMPTPLLFPLDAATSSTTLEEVLAKQFGGKLDKAATPPPDPMFVPPEDYGATFFDAINDALQDVFFPEGESIATPTMAFSTFAQTAIDSALVCAVTMKEDRSMSDPFLMVIGAPTAVCRGHTRSKLWTGQPPHVLQPEGITGPKDVVFPTLGTTSPDLRDPSIKMENRTPSYYLQEHEKVCFSANGWLYRLVMAPEPATI